MLVAYQDNFARLSEEQTRLVWSAVHKRYPTRVPPPPVDADGMEAFLRIGESGLDHAQVVLCMATETDLVALAAVECLVGKGISRQFKRTPAPRQVVEKPDRGRAQRATTAPWTPQHVIETVTENPKRQGTASYERYAKYRVGMTVAEALAAGITRGDLAWDTERGFVVLRSPTT